MQTLLEKVQHIEEEAAHLVEEAEQRGKQTLLQVKENEERVVDEVRENARLRGEAIVKEHIQKTGAEINALKQEGEQAVNMVHKAAEKNRGNTLAKAMAYFNEEFLS